MPLPVDGPDPHAYTSGRWLRRDKLERDARFLKFDFEALCRKVIELSPGATSIANYQKFEGGFNRVFIFTTDNTKRVVARLPFRHAGPNRLTTNSEVATIGHLQKQTSIPIPRILASSDDASNGIGSEYIIMEHDKGVQLHQLWPSMTGLQQVRLIDSIYQKVKEMVDLDFPSYGSLYSDIFLLDNSDYHRLNEELYVGPHCGPIYWDCNVGESRYYQDVKPNRGPWTNLTKYGDGLVDTGLSMVPQNNSELQALPRYQGNVEEHRRILGFGRAVIRKLSADPLVKDVARPTLYHPDLHKRNIFVAEEDPTTITAIIDWQASAIEPAFWYADEVPDFARPVPHPSLADQFEPDSARCAKVFSLRTQYLVPTLARPRLMDESPFRPYRYCYRTWKDGIVAFRHELIQTAQCWEQLGLAGACPYPLPSSEELAIHQEEYQRFTAAHELKSTLSSLLNTATDGWVPPDEFESARIGEKEMFDGILEAVLNDEDPDDDEPIRTEKDLKEIWPFDLGQQSLAAA